MNTPSTTKRGRLAEERALSYLINEGLIEVARNYRSSRGEIDLIMLDGNITVFVEVRARVNSNIMHPVETIDRRKQSHIVHTSQHYLQHVDKNKSRYFRFDVICLTGPLETANIEWIKNAFDA